MLAKIKEQLETGKINRVVIFGQDVRPEPPYIVIKPERDPIGRGRTIRIIIHVIPGQQLFLDDYARNDIENLLYGFKGLSRHNNYNKLLTENDYTDIITENDDKTISMERVFLLPSMSF